MQDATQPHQFCNLLVGLCAGKVFFYKCKQFSFLTRVGKSPILNATKIKERLTTALNSYMLRLSAIIYILLSLLITAHAENYHWPMDAPPALTSTFGEYRGGRLHAAIDLKTYGKEGYPVTAIADGYVWRVRTSPWGYGRVVYVQLDNGLFALWAHLSGFSKPIEKYVQQEQDRRGTYSVNLYFRPDQIPVKRGEIVGYSGSTGIGVPHLHFELRDAKHRPINPLLHGFDIKDTIPPNHAGGRPRTLKRKCTGQRRTQASITSPRLSKKRKDLHASRYCDRLGSHRHWPESI